MSRRSDPFEEIEELFDQLTQFGGSGTTQLSVDILETDAELVVLTDLPGRDPDQISLQLPNDRELTIEAPPAEADVEGEYVSRERPKRSVSRTIRLPAVVSMDETEANYERGVLEVRLGKPEESSGGTEIQVN